MNRPTRILSDIHFGHPASAVRDPDQLAPLLEGVQRAIFNGDSVEMRFVEERPQAKEDIQRLHALCDKAGVERTFVTGNHDPLISTTNHVELAGGGVLVTHGDVLFEGLSPWSREADVLISAHREAREALSDPGDLQQQLGATKRAALAIEHLGHSLRCTSGKSLRNFLYEFWPPLRPFRILTCWAAAPQRAAKIAEDYRPETECVVFGHTHRSGVWRRGERIVINTGSYLPLSGCLAVDVNADREVVVRKVVRSEKLFRLGKEVARFPVG